MIILHHPSVHHILLPPHIIIIIIIITTTTTTTTNTTTLVGILRGHSIAFVSFPALVFYADHNVRSYEVWCRWVTLYSSLAGDAWRETEKEWWLPKPTGMNGHTAKNIYMGKIQVLSVIHLNK